MYRTIVHKDIHSCTPVWFPRSNIGVFPKWSRTFIEFSEFRESDNSLQHELGSILKILSLMCFAGAVVVLCSLTQEVAGLCHFNDKYFCH